MAGIFPTTYGGSGGGILDNLIGNMAAASAAGPGNAVLQQRFLQSLQQDPRFQQLSPAQQFGVLNDPEQLRALNMGTVVPTGTGGAINYNPLLKQATPIQGYNVMPAPIKTEPGDNLVVPTVGANGQPSAQNIYSNGTGMLTPAQQQYAGARAAAGDRSVYTGNRSKLGAITNQQILSSELNQEMGASTPQQQAQVQNQYKAQGNAINAFGAGPLGNATRSFSVALDHAGVFKDLAQAMGNSNIQAINAIKNEWQKQIGSPLPTNVNAAKQILSAEMAKAIQGSDVAEGDRERLQEALGAANSWPQLAGVIDQVYTPLLSGQIHGLMRQYIGSTGMGAPSYYNMLSPRAQQVLGPVPVQNATDYGQVKSGQQYLAPDGSVRTKQ